MRLLVNFLRDKLFISAADTGHRLAHTPLGGVEDLIKGLLFRVYHTMIFTMAPC